MKPRKMLSSVMMASVLVLIAVLTALAAWMLMPTQAVWAACGDTDPRTVLCVDSDATGVATGLSWTDAYTNVQDALDYTHAHYTTTYEIWVAEGVYYPDEDSDGDHTDNSRDEFFTLRYNNVQLYGGFAGTETARDQRDWDAHVTILSGDIDANDWNTDTNYIAETWHDIQGSNAYHVLHLDGVTNEPITKTTVIDGFTVTAGKKYVTPHDDGGGLYCNGAGSGNACSPTLANIIFSGSLADQGGGLYNDGSSSGTSNPVLTNVTFSGNLAVWGGGGMANNGANGTSSPVLTNVTFSGNQSNSDCGGMRNRGTSGISSPALTNVIFQGNLAIGDGGGMCNHGSDNGLSNPSLTNVTFCGNQAATGGGIYNDGSSSGNSSPMLTNVILWGNTASTGLQIHNNSATPTVDHSLIEGGCPAGTICDGILISDPLFAAPITATVAPTTAGNYRLQTGSPAINAGDNDALTVATDLDGNPRIADGVVDLGAYEYGSFYVTATDPANAAIAVSPSAPISAAFNAPVSATTVSTRTFTVRGAQTGIYAGSYLADSNVVSFDHATDFKPGEDIVVNVSDGLSSSEGATLTQPYAWSFRAAVGGGSGVFVDSGQSLGNATSYGVTLGDLDSDDDLDAFVTNWGQSNKVWLNNGDGNFTEGQSIAGTYNHNVALGDVDSDGDLDALIADKYSASKVWLNNGSGSFSDSGQNLGSSSHTIAVVLGDLDGDGDLDAFVGNASSDGGDEGTGFPNEVWLNDGNGNFTSDGQSLGDSHSYDVRLGDLDNDGDLDAFVANFGGPNKVYMNDGTGHFVESGQSLGSAYSFDAALGDMDADGDLDAFIGNRSDQANKLWLNDGTGVFSDSGQSLGTSNTTGMVMGDIDDDGDLDICAGNWIGQVSKVWINDGTGTMVDSGQNYNFSSGAALGDLDGDGDLDIFSSNRGNSNASQPNRVYLNRNDHDLTLTQTVTPTVAKSGQAVEGQPVTYTLTYANIGIFTATGVLITDVIPLDHLTEVSYTFSGAPITATDSAPYTWLVADLPPDAGGVITVTGQLAVDAAELPLHLTNTATITSAEGDDVPGNNTASATIYLPPIPPESVTLTGPTVGQVGAAYLVRASVAPPTVTLPLTYTWRTPAHAPQTRTLHSTQDAVAYVWQTGGPQPITVTVDNGDDPVTAVHTIDICAPLTDLTLRGPAVGARGAPLVFTATANPEASAPMTYEWRIANDELGIFTHTTNFHTDTFTATWPTPGAKTITLTARNCGAQAVVTRAVDVRVPPARVDLSGPEDGRVRVGQTFTASVEPDGTLLLPAHATPITYTWRAAGQPPLVRRVDRLTDTAAFTWTTTGARTITVSVTNGAGAVADSRILRLIAPPSGVAISGPPHGATDVAHAFVATISPDDVTLPLTCTWQATGQPDVTHVLTDAAAFAEALGDTVAFTWGVSGTQLITVTAQNADGVAKAATPVDIALPIPPGDAFEVDDDCSQARFIPVDGTQQAHTFHVTEDEDWVAFQATAGITYVIEARVPSTSSADVSLGLFQQCDGDPDDGQDPTFTTDVRMMFQPPEDGAYFIRLRNGPQGRADESAAYQLTVRRWRYRVPGALVLVAGRLKANDNVQTNIYQVAGEVYTLFRRHGYDPARLRYLAPDLSQPHVTTRTTHTHLREAILNWAPEHIAEGGFLTLYLVDHGESDLFYLDELAGEQLAPADLDEWLTEFEKARPDAKVNLIIEACKSGSFIALAESVSKEGRVIVTSTGPDLPAYASAQGGALFSDAFLRGLDQGQNLYQASQEGVWAVAHLRQTIFPQTPWVNGDADAVPNEPEDIQEARRRTLTGINTDLWAPHIVTVTVAAGATPDERVLCAEVTDDQRVDEVWGIVYAPSYTPPEPGAEMVTETPRAVSLRPQGADHYCARHPGFDELGTYRIVVSAVDNENLQARPTTLELATGGEHRVYLPLVLRVQ